MNKYASEVNELYNASVNQCFRVVTEILSVGCLLGHLGDCLGFCWLVSHIYIYRWLSSCFYSYFFSYLLDFVISLVRWFTGHLVIYRMVQEKVARLPFCTVNHYVTTST
jgi:hypothetical protein